MKTKPAGEKCVLNVDAFIVANRYYLGEGGRETRVENAILAKFRL